MNIVALAGGVGGAKLADGLQRVGEPLTIIVNTGDDFEWHGLSISPDLDTVMYTLAGIANPETGWGIADDTFNDLVMLNQYGAETWFRIGDRDLATQVLRIKMLHEGKTLAQVTEHLSRALGVRTTTRIVPMTNERVATMVNTNEGELPFQEYFVKRHCEPIARSFRFAGIENARPADGILDALARADAMVFCPSNPFVSLEPILSVRGVRERIAKTKAKRVAVSPIVGGEAIKGPAAKMFRELGFTSSARAVAERYRGLIDAFVIDEVDRIHEMEIRKLGMDVWVTNTVMKTTEDRERLAREIVAWALS